MSDQHEPPCTGRLILHTSYGDLQLDLWCKECPRACRNFIQLALEGYFEGKLVDCIIPGCAILMGGGGMGEVGEIQNVYGEAFGYEYHPRLKYTRRGLVGMVPLHDSLPNPTKSLKEVQHNVQFFITLGAASQLDRKATLFGQLVGETMFNVLRIAELEIDPATGRPLYPPRLERVSVISHPFDDITPRAKPTVKVSEVVKAAAPKRNKKLLSFVDDEEDDEDAPVNVISSHEVLTNDPLLSRRQVKDTVARVEIKPPLSSPLAQLREERAERLSTLKAEQRALKRELTSTPAEDMLFSPAKKSTSRVKTSQAEIKKSRPASVSKLSRLLDGYQRGNRRSNEVETLIKLDQFRQKLTTTCDPLQLSKVPALEPAPLLDLCKLHGLASCASCRDTFGIQEAVGDDEGWLMHRLVFDKEAGYREMRQDLDNLLVIDPREKAKQLLKNKK